MNNTFSEKSKLSLEIDGSLGLNFIVDKMQESFGQHLFYHIYNVPETDYVQFYEKLASDLGPIRGLHPVNDKTKKFSISRDIKPDPSLYHYYASNTRQPLHTDYAYYPEENAADWLMLYCLLPSEYGGRTHLLSSLSLTEILLKFKPDLLEKLQTEIVWSYEGVDGDKIHKRPILDNGKINWNYWQIKNDLNPTTSIEIRDEFFKFLEEMIVSGGIYDFTKIWKKGDAIIFNDKYSLHGRDAFLGERWLKDHAFFNPTTSKEIL